MRQLAAAIVASALAACSGDIGEAPTASTVETPQAAPTPPFELSPEHATLFLSKLAPALIGRVMTADERAAVAREGGRAIGALVRRWTMEPGFVKAARNLVEQKLSVSGTRDGVDFGLPGNLAEHLVKHDLPWSGLLTDASCWDANDQPIACDTGAPYTAGVLTTRAYMVSRASRFNLTRSSTLMKAFACRNYPQEEWLQPRVDKARLIPMFRALTAEEQTDERAKSGFGNGMGCYVCHGQFSAHAQLFVKFDDRGLWRKDATGLQDEAGELGRSKDGLMASHFVDPIEASSEASQMFGKPVANLAEAAKVLAESEVFLECASRNVLEYGLGLTKPPELEPPLLRTLAARARLYGGASPSLAAITVATLTHPDVQRSVVKMLTGAIPPSRHQTTETAGATP